MIKATLITLISAGVLGTGAQTFTPQSLNVTAGHLQVEIGAQGLNVDVTAKPDFAVTSQATGEREFTVRF